MGLPSLILPIMGKSVWADNYSVDFDGVNEYIALPNSYSALSTGAISFWFKVHSAPAEGNDKTIISFSDKDDALSLFKVGIYNTGGFNFISIMNVENAVFNIQAYGSDTSVVLNVWTHAIVMQTGAEYRIYINGANQTLTSIAGRPTTGTRWIDYVTNIDFTSIAVTQAGSTLLQFYDGQIDDVGIYNAGDPTKVAEKYNGGVPNNLRTLSDVANLVGYYLMGDFNGTSEYPTIIDRISSNNGTMTNMEAADIVNDTP